MGIKDIHDAKVVKQTLSDNSIAYNVEVLYERTKLIFACTNRQHAAKLRDYLNNTAWVEVETYPAATNI